jgi:hypothetical protein
MDEGHIVVDSIAAIRTSDITDQLARESGFTSAEDLLETASHGGGDNVYLIRFHYLPAGAWDVQADEGAVGENRRTLLQRIRRSTSPAVRSNRKQRNSS